MSAHSRILLSLAIFALVLILSSAEDKKQVVSYHGIIREDAREGDEVTLDRTLRVNNRDKLMGSEICGYTLYKSYSELPFKVVLLSRKDGTAKIVLSKGYTLNYERRYRYSFDIAAHDCSTGVHTDREKVFIEVQDVNEFSPHWAEEMYLVEVEEGRYFSQIVKLEASDEDGSDKYSLICDYHIDTEDVPFTVDSHGYLQNTAPLDYSEKHNFILEVRAIDCGGLSSPKIMVNIAVKETCKKGWKAIPSSLQFTPGSGTLVFADQAELDLCSSGTPAPPAGTTPAEGGATVVPCGGAPAVSVTVALGGQQQQVCDKDVYSLQAQRRMCGSAPETVDLLPNPTLGTYAKAAKPTLSSSTQNSDQTFSFDGITSALELDPARINYHLGDSFSISTWMAHEGTEADSKHEGSKQHVLCHSDGDYHNRHHYSVFVHNCHLVLLLRREPGEKVDLNQFRPAEWRWAAPEVCDGQWHHYAINVDFPESVHLYVDGHRTVENEQNPVIVDDWPLHPSKKVSSTKLVIGACWHGGDKTMAQYFRGQLAGLTLLRDRSESDHTIQCLSDCKEKLDFHDMADLETGMSVSLNSEMSHITFNGHNKSHIERLVQHVGYKNARVYPTPGPRTLTMTTKVECPDKTTITIPDVMTTVTVAMPEKPTLRLSGSDRVTYSEQVVSRGSSVFADVSISVNHADNDDVEVDEEDESSSSEIMITKEDEDEASKYQLDSCLVRADPALDIKKETLTYPRNMVTALGLEVSANDEGLIIAGADIVKHYIQVLRAIHYVHTTPEMLNTRHFVVSCTELNGRFVSNDYEVQLDVIHKDRKPVAQPVAHHQQNAIYNQLSEVRIQDTARGSAQISAGMGSVGTAAGTGVGMIVIIVVCVGFLMFMIVLGVIRIRSAQQRREVTMDDKPEMEWDNSALTITVNPMENGNAYDEEAVIGGLQGDDSDTDDDDDGMSHDDVSDTSEDEGVKVTKDNGLEWDDSTLTF